MKRVYTDERFPGFEVHNDGSIQFYVYERDPRTGQLQEIDAFKTCPGPKGAVLPEEVAARRAKDYFERMAHGQMNAELAERPEMQDLPGNPDRDHTEILNNPPPEGSYGLSASKSLDDLMGDNVMTADHVVDAYERAKAIEDPQQREAALKQVASMSQQMESAAQELVRRLLN